MLDKEDEELLTALLPVFEDGLTVEQVKSLALHLFKSKVFSKVALQSINISQGQQTIVEFVNAIKSTSKEGWKVLLVSCLRVEDKPELAALVERCFNKDENKHLVWILDSWDDLVKHETSVKEVAWMITHQKIEAENWLLEFSYLITSAEADSKMVETVMALLQEKLSPLSSMSIISGVSSIDASSLMGGESQQSGDFGADVDRSLLPLSTLLDTSLSHNHIVAIARALYDSNHIPQSAFKAVESADSRQGYDMRTANQFVKMLGSHARADWKEALLKAIQTTGQDALFSIVKQHLFDANAYMSHLLQNWHTLLQNKNYVLRIAGIYPISHDVNEAATNWLLTIVHRLLTCSDKDIFPHFVFSLFGKGKPDPAAVEKNEKPETSRQAIKQEHVLEGKETKPTVKTERARSTSPFSSIPPDKFTNITATGDYSSVEDISMEGQAPQLNPPLPGFDDSQPRESGGHVKMERDIVSPTTPDDSRVFMDPTSLELQTGNVQQLAQKLAQQRATAEVCPGQAQREVKTTPRDQNEQFDQFARERATSQDIPSDRPTLTDDTNAQTSQTSEEMQATSYPPVQVMTRREGGSPQVTDEPMETEDGVESFEFIDAEEADLTDQKSALSTEEFQKAAANSDNEPQYAAAKLAQEYAQQRAAAEVCPGQAHRGVTPTPQDQNEQFGQFARERATSQDIPSDLPTLTDDTNAQAEEADLSNQKSALATEEFQKVAANSDNEPPSAAAKEFVDERRKRQIHKDNNKAAQRPVATQPASQPSSFVEAAKKNANSTPKQKKKKTEQAWKISEEKPALDDYSPEYFGKLAMNDNYALEFRAHFAESDFQPHGSDSLCVLLVNQRLLCPMYHDTEIDAYRLTIVLPKSYEEVYKYCIVRGDKKYWEMLPVDNERQQIRNRVVKVEHEQKSRGHAVMFDVILMQPCDVATYRNLYQQHLPGHLPSMRGEFDENPASGANITTLHKTFVDWFISAGNEVTIRTEGSYYPTRIEYHKRKGHVIHEYVDHILMLSNETDMKCHVKRILCLLAFVTAMERRRVPFEDDEIKVKICNGLSLHDIDEENQSTLLVHLTQFAHQFGLTKMATRFTSLSYSFDCVFQRLVSVPESLLSLPLLKLIQGLLDDKITTFGRPRMPTSVGWEDVVISLKKNVHQRAVKRMAEIILILMERFPWIRDVYKQIVGLEITSELLSPSAARFYALFDIETIFDKLLRFWKITTTTWNSKGFNEGVARSFFLFLTKAIHQQSESIKKFRECTPENDKIRTMLIDKSLQLLGYVLKHIEQDPPCHIPCISYCFVLFDDVLLFGEIMDEVKGCDELTRDIKKFQTELLTAVHWLFSANHTKESTSHEVSFWNSVSGFKWSDEQFLKKWVRVCNDAMHKCIPQKFPKGPKSLLEFYAERFEEMKPNELVSDCFANAVTQAVEKSLLGEKKSLEYLHSKFVEATGYGKPKLLKICLKIFNKQWTNVVGQKSKQIDRDEAFLQFLLTWTPAPKFIRILCNPDVLTMLRDDQVTILDGLVSSIQSLIIALKTGDVLVQNLKKMSAVQKSFVECYEAIEPLMKIRGSDVDTSFSSEELTNLVTFRCAELDAFFHLKKCVQAFVSFAVSLKADNITVDVSELKKKLEFNVLSLKLRGLVQCWPVIPGKLIGLPTVHHITFFQLTPEDKGAILELEKTKALSSNVIKEQIKKVARNSGRNQMTISDVLQQVWIPAAKQVIGMIQNLDQGSIQLKAVKEMFGDAMNNGRIENAIKELSLLYDIQRKVANVVPVQHFQQRTEQIRNYFELKQKIRTAEVLDNIRQKLELEGSFDALTMALEMGEQADEKQLNTITKETIEFTAVLHEISEEQLNILEQFAEGNLIEWLKKHMKDIGEVKVMSDLAMISAGETPMEVDRVSCFLSAVMGFSSLIFELPPASGLKELLQACKEVWKSVERDPGLTIKWAETSKHLEWLSAVKDFHGSVEKSSLTRAQQINTRGVYKIGGECKKMPTVDDCLKLFLVKQEGDAEDIVMSLSELRDLQSRLMLIAGEADKGKQDVNKFIDVLSNVETLAKAYVKLKLSGCLLFTNWRATIRCTNDDERQHVTVEVYFDETSPAISSSENVIQEVKQLTTVLTDAHKQWMAYLTDKRNEHYHLNHFNIHQLTYLCQKLASNDEHDFPDQVYMLLASVNENVTFDYIVDCLDEATKIDDDNEQEEISMIHADESSTSIVQKKKKTVRKLVQLELSENVAKAAVQSVRSLDVDDCYLWGLENEFEEEKVETLRKQFDEEAGFEASGANINVIQNVINERMNLTLEEVIRRIQQDLEDSDDESVGITVKTVCERYFNGTAVTSLDDCVSLEHLGQFLAMIGMAVDKASLPNRSYPETFASGKPNLIVCPLVDMWQTILSIYKQSPDQPLPLATEVLVCCKTTTAEEVELLLRRAIGAPVDEGKRIYCLACADEMPFIVAKETEEKFQQLIQMSDKNAHYQLVILTSSSQHYITSIFDEHQVDGSFSSSEESMAKYLQQHLCVNNVKNDTAAKVDRDQSCVRFVRSERAGMGKSQFVLRCRETLEAMFQGTVYWKSSTIRLLEKDVDIDDIIQSLLHSDQHEVANKDPHFVHIDITPSVQKGVCKFLFDLIILGVIKNSHGVIWRRQPEHFYALEYTVPSVKGILSFTNLLDLLPTVTCLSPLDVQTHLQENPNQPPPLHQVLMDKILFKSEMYQRPFQYLAQYLKKHDLDTFTFNPKKTVDNPLECLQTLLRYCSIKDPSWSELSHFSGFLNVQLQDCEKSIFYNVRAVVRDSGMEGFRKFVVRFMIRMSQDFATPSLNVDDDHGDDDMEYENEDDEENQDNNLFELHQLRRRWESKFHPYLFFNDDHASMSFVHFNVNRQGHLCHPKTKEVVEQNIMGPNLVKDLMKYNVPLQQDFDLLKRDEKLATLCKVFGVKTVFDPDPTYELTTDNVLKMLAIHMRFRCGIPVVVMGETGCGKTRMVEFMSKLKRGNNKDIQNMVVVKVHGGITVSVIQDKVLEAIKLAKKNNANGKVETILFLDEANTTEAIYAIKEIVCDGTVHGEKFLDTDLKIVAACNPYRRHTEEVIKSMEQSGLGFHVKAENVTDKFAGIPMRQLVYRVIPLPPSMQPLVWDFGQLNNDTEAIYIKQMIIKLQKDIKNDKDLPDMPAEMVDVLSATLTASQVYMRQKRDVCSFVSLRDVERTIQSFMWFYKQLQRLNPMIAQEKARMKNSKKNITRPFQALIHSLGMCYHATLNERTDYRKVISEQLVKVGRVQITEKDILEEIIACQNVFINAIKLEKDIAKNEALRENVFMMVVCAEMRIPLFLVGKPGSSKSLAKTIVTDAMQGRNSRNELFRQLKEIHVISFQCSAVSDAVGIEAVFNQCAQLQKKRDLKEYVALVVLDEIGLAEDSPKMPLKVLHPLLETASTNSRLDADPHWKVGFVGISNWALDPAKMNRGIFVTRGKPSKLDLQKTAEAIFEADKVKINEVDGVIKAVTDAYLEVYEAQHREFFGLRDYYGLLKMIFSILSDKHQLDFHYIARSVLRNFSGYSHDVSKVFDKHFSNVFTHVYRPSVHVTELIHENLNSEFESRFLLLLTKQYSAVSLLPKVMGKIEDYQVIFGSSFPHDHDYTEVCRNINRIKVCMETGRAVVLLNLRDLYESLYDALNQHYVTFADQRYIDLGLGGHRVKCRVATGFRLIVIEEKKIVYEEFPIPLINRLEKYVFEMNSVLGLEDIDLVHRLKEWMMMFSKLKKVEDSQQSVFTEEDTFAGYKDDTPASALLSVNDIEGEKYELAQEVLLQTASLDGVCRLSKSELFRKAETFQNMYMNNQHHDTLWKKLKDDLKRRNQISIFEITSFAQVLNERDRQELERLLGLDKSRVMLLTLQQFQTEQEYSGRVDEFFEFTLSPVGNDEMDDPLSTSFILLIQCPQAHLHSNLIACAKYSAMNKVKEFKKNNPYLTSTIIVAFLFTMERHNVSTELKASFTSFHSQSCSSIYIDELRPVRDHIAPVSTLWRKTIPEILQEVIHNKEETGRLFDIHRLLSECIRDAMAKLQNEDGPRGRNRIMIMNTLCFKSPLSVHFAQILFHQILSLLRDRENRLENQDFWIVQVACSAQSLQEGGSFRNALWLHLRKVFAVAVAKIISIADMDDNLDLIANDGEANNSLADLWLQMFASAELCDLRWSDIGGGTDFIVKRQFHFKCSFPFFRIVFESLDKQWKIIQERKLSNVRETFIEKVNASVVQGFLDLACEKNAMLVIQQFVHDLVHFLYKSSTQDTNFEMEFETVQDCIFGLFTAQRKLKKEQHCNALVEAFIIYMEIQSQLQQFAEIVGVRSDILTDRHEWVKEQSKTSELIMHKLAFKTLLEKLQTEAPKDIAVLEKCKQWKALVSKVKHVADALIPISRDNTKQSWKQIAFVEIFLDQLIPTSAPKQTTQNYLTTLAPLARRLWMGASKLKDLSDLKFLNIITKTMQGCTKDIELRLLCSWNDVKCKSCRSDKMSVPVLLPCGHYVCQKCVPFQAADTSCPICREKITEPEELQPVRLSIEKRKELEAFKSACTSFFLEYLSTFCFPPPNSVTYRQRAPPPDQNITLALEKLVICDNSTKNMSPLLSNFDTNPTARSYILQLLLRCDANLVENQLNEHFRTMETVLNDKGILMDICIRCMQDILESWSYRYDEEDSGDDSVNAEYAHELLKECRTKPTLNLSQIQHLDLSAKLQYIARVAVSCIVALENKRAFHFKDYQSMLWFTKDVGKLCTDPKYLVMQQYIIKNLCRRHGMNAFQTLLKNNTYRPLIPENLIPAKDAEKENHYLQSDLLVLCGEGYVRTKTLLLDVAHETDFEPVFTKIVHELQQSADSILQILLALSVWTAQGDVETELRKKTYDYIVGHLQMHLAGRMNQQIFNDIAKGSLHDIPFVDMNTQLKYKVIELLENLGVTLLCSGESLLASLVQLIANPGQLLRAFLPTMPASNFFMVKKVLQKEISHNTSPKSYLCPNGHVYFIGECTNPVQAGICPECHQRIGGQKYGLLHDGNTVGEITEESQAGYKLGAAESRTPATPERKLTKLSVCATRICIHGAMLLGARHGNEMQKMTKVNGQRNEVFAFLLQHMMKDFDELSKCLGRSIDDTFIVMHQILHKMRTTNVVGQQQNFSWQTMDAREVWEEEFQRSYLSLIFKDTDALINKAQAILIEAGKLAEKPLERLVHELVLENQVPDGLVKWDCPNLWRYRIHVDMQHLRQKLEAVDAAVAGEGTMLKTILSTENLELVQYIPEVLNLQATLIARYRQKFDMSDAENTSLRDYLEEENDCFEYEINLYIRIWNKVRHLLVNCDRYNTPRCYFSENMNLESPVSMCLPSKKGRGCCALVLAEYLVDKQNNLLQQCRELTKPRPTFITTDAAKCTKKNVICINERKALMPLVLQNSQYETTADDSGYKHSITYNLGLLEKKVLEKFILRKAEIKKETIPLMQYPQDMGLAKDYETVRSNAANNQIALHLKMCQDIDAFVDNATTPNLCEAVRTLTLVIQFLAKLGADPEQTICDYAEKELLLPSEETEMIPKSAQIRHCLALYERLSWHRSRRLIGNGRNPFENVVNTAEEIKDEQLITELKEELAAMNVQRLQLELNALLMVGPEMDPDWSLGEDVLFNYLDLKYDDVDNSWCSKIPTEVLFKNAVHVFQLSMAYAAI